MITPEMVDAMIESGCTAEQLAAVVKASLKSQQKGIEEKREKDRQRKRLSRAKNSQVIENKENVSRGQPVTECDKKRKKEPKKEKNSNIILPPYIPPQLWEEFSQMRKEKRKPLTERTANGVIKKIEEYRQQGHDPPDLLRRAIDHEWLTVYPRKNDENTNRDSTKPTRSEKIADAKRQALADLGVVCDSG